MDPWEGYSVHKTLGRAGSLARYLWNNLNIIFTREYVQVVALRESILKIYLGFFILNGIFKEIIKPLINQQKNVIEELASNELLRVKGREAAGQLRETASIFWIWGQAAGWSMVKITMNSVRETELETMPYIVLSNKWCLTHNSLNYTLIQYIWQHFLWENIFMFHSRSHLFSRNLFIEHPLYAMCTSRC